MADDWGCNVDLFGGAVETEKPKKSLTELVDLLSKKNKNQTSITNSESENVTVIPCQKPTTKIGLVHAPKILKKKKVTTNNNNKKFPNETNVKRVTFEIEQLLSREAAKDDRQKARERMLKSLGAAPLKGKYINYKDLKAELSAKKEQEKLMKEMNNGNNLAMTIIKKKNKKK